MTHPPVRPAAWDRATPPQPQQEEQGLCRHGMPTTWPCPDCEARDDAPGEDAPTTGARSASRIRGRLLDRAQLREIPSPQPLIEKVLDLRTTALLAGQWGTCKSFIALDWCACVATGKPWLGREVSTPGGVLYIAAEGAHGLNQRLTAWELGWQTKVPPERFHVIPAAVLLGQHRDLADLLDVVAELDPLLTVVDTVARCAAGLDENSARDMGMFVHALDRIRSATSRGTVLAVHHTGKGGQIRGSSAIEGAMDTVHKTEGDPQRLVLTNEKRKDAPRSAPITLGLDSVPEAGSAVLKVVRGAADKIISAQTLMSAFVSAFAVSGASKAELRTVAAMPSASFHRALNACLEDGLLVNEGSDARPFYRLGAAS